jgi:phage terminase large subunit GpA-like protein
MPADFFDQITAERFDLVLKRWIKRSATVRNEAWDCWIYAYAAACHPRVRLHVKRDADWAALEAKREPGVGDMFAAGDAPRETSNSPSHPEPGEAPRETSQSDPALPGREHITRRGRKGGFATNW